MNMLAEILGANNGAVVRQLAGQFGLGENDARNAIGSLLPALAQGLKRNTGSQSGLESLFNALAQGQHAQYVDQPDVLSRQDAELDGNGILGHILGSKEVSRKVAGQAAASTGLDVATLKKMLPLLASVAMGVMSKQGAANRGLSQRETSAMGAGLSSLLDMDGDGSIADDILNFAKKLF
jgi:hypothetical protein